MRDEHHFEAIDAILGASLLLWLFQVAGMAVWG